MNEKPKILGVTGGAVSLSALALAFGACCVSPWAVTLLGVSGAVLLARLAVVQPYVVALTLVLVGLGFWFAYRRAPSVRGAACAAGNRLGLQWLVWIAALIVIAADVVSFAPLFLS
ncbi:MAG TPA: hypothetical protein VG274_08820 [Rhizomicrobium sp.]|jgi:ABC-type Na+ efflux pump permease subunit|nr:hypothetical protein [Rhizomicrobium sp.]